MAMFRQPCDVYQGYNFRKDRQTPVGFITAMTLGDVTLSADQEAKDPLSPAEDLKVVAVLSDVMWELGVTDAHYLSGQISTANADSVKLLTYRDMTRVEVTYTFVIYDYDPIERRYFKSLVSDEDATLYGMLERNGRDLNLSVADDPSTEVQSPENFAFSVGVTPQPKAQRLTVSTSYSRPITKAWGLAEP